MPKTEKIVINTSPLIALVAANGDLNILRFLYKEVLVPFEVCQEIRTGGSNNFAIAPGSPNFRKPIGYKNNNNL